MLPFQDTRPFQNRRDAGKKLAQKLQRYANRSDVSVFALPRGGVPVAYEVALALNASMDVFIVWKFGFLGQVAEQELKELQRRESNYRGDRSIPNVFGRIVILIDDGLVAETSMRVAVAGVRIQNPKRIVVAVPTAAPKVCKVFETEVDEVICLITPEPFLEIGRWYADFSQTTDEDISLLLKNIREESTTRDIAISLKTD